LHLPLQREKIFLLLNKKTVFSLQNKNFLVLRTNMNKKEQIDLYKMFSRFIVLRKDI